MTLVSTRSRPWVGAVLALGALVLASWASLALGSLASAGNAGSYGAAVVWDLRWPRTLTGLLVGAALAAAGCLMQALTRNPLADPSVLGVNNGAAFALVACLAVFHLKDPLWLWVAALAGGAATATLVWFLGSVREASPARWALAGVVVTSLLGSWTSALLLQNKESLDTVRVWLAGSLGAKGAVEALWLAPALGAGLIGTFAVARSLDVLGLGSDSARALGVNVELVRNVTLALVVWLSALAVSLAGPVAFIGLAVPHLARALVGPELARNLPLSLVLGPLLLLTADVVGRVILPPSEVPVGVVTAVLGAPLLIALVLVRRAK